MALPRRPVITGLVVVALIALGFVAAALTNPWHLTSLYPLAGKGLAIGLLVLAGALLAAAGLWQLSARGVLRDRNRVVLASAAGLASIAALCAAVPLAAFAGSFRHEGAAQVLAVSPDGEVSAVKSTLDTPAGRLTRIYLRSRDGLFSRESSVPAAECPFDPFARGVPAESVRFTSDNTLALPIADQPTTVVRFDPGTLLPDRTVMICDANR